MKKIGVLFCLFFLFPIRCLAITDTSHSSIVMDIDSGRILYQKDSNTERLIASTTKLMTFLTAVTYAGDRLEEKVVVGDEVLKMYGTNLYLSLDEEVKFIDLLYGLILRSGNDASVVIAKFVSGDIDSFVSLMNELAKEIGMQNSIFKNPHGLDEETKNYSTAYDLAVLTRYLYLNYPIYREIAKTKYYDFASNLKSYSLTNRCRIIFTYSYITSCKNGYTPLAGKSLVTTASKDNLNVLIVTLDDFDIYENHKRLYEYYFDLYHKELILEKQKFTIPNDKVDAKYYIKEDFFYPLKKEELNAINTKILLDEKDKTLGKVQIFLKNNLIHEEIIYKEKENKKENISIFDKVKKIVKNLFK